MDPTLERIAASRPRVAAEIARPHSEEALLLGVVSDLLPSLASLATALGARGTYERCLLWGVDVATGAEDSDAGTDLVVVTSEEVVAVDVAVGRPGHAAARARRGEGVPSPAAPLAESALALATPLSRRAVIVALAGRAADLLHPDRDDVATWSEAAAALPVASRTLSWAQLADRLAAEPGTAAAVLRIRTHPTLAGR